MDLSATRQIKSLYTVNGNQYEVGRSAEKITAEEKTGDMAYIIWYQIWQNGEIIREVNSLHVEDVEYMARQQTNRHSNQRPTCGGNSPQGARDWKVS